MRSITDFNDNWLFQGAETVRLPHAAVELPLTYFDENSYQRVFSYEKAFDADPAWDGRDVVVHFEGAMANAKVTINGEHIASHADGYTPFEVRLTGRIKPAGNVLKVEIDGSENPDIPPFGGQIDYLTYAGIYRDVLLRVTAPVSIGLHKIETPDVTADTKSVRVAVTLNNPDGLEISGKLSAKLTDPDGRAIAETEKEITGESLSLSFDDLEGIDLWDIDAPNLYSMSLELRTPHGADAVTTRFGFRDAVFTQDGFFLNGRHLKIVGLNRHQSFPYVGYALGPASQIRDADILKYELRLNTVRTSHYPQSNAFLDRCDEIGLLVFEEIPGWQHIGDEAWQAEAVENVRRMIRRDWNHPSIILWGVRINESADNHDFYAETNRVARELDPTRQTGGVRCITDSEMLEDVYTMNDFILGDFELPGSNRPRTPLRDQKEVTGLRDTVPYLVTEYGGHMYPTKTFDQEQRQAEHVTRHLEVLNAMFGDPRISGAIGWCAFDYNTHKDFGSGDRICHHGVMDMFREPKFAAHVYASQGDRKLGPVMEPVTFWTRGDRNIGGNLPLIVLTNCDEVELRYGDHPPKRVGPDRERFAHLPHPPVIIDHRHFSADELGLWGMSWEGGELTGFIGGEPVLTRRMSAAPVLSAIALEIDSEEIGVHEDMRFVVRALDQEGHTLPYLFDSVDISVSGPARLFGPSQVPLRGGVIGGWIRSTGRGEISIEVGHPLVASVSRMIRSEPKIS
jgi:beta-galactosidase